MEEEVLEEYNRCKEEAGAQTVRLRSDLERLEAERK